MQTSLISEASSLVQILEHRAADTPNRIVYTFLEDGDSREINLSLAELAQDSHSIAANLLERARPGEPILLVYEAGLDYIRAFFACLRAGLVAVPVYPPRVYRRGRDRNMERLWGIAADCGARFALTTAAIREKFGETQSDMRWEWVATDSLPRLNENNQLTSIAREDPAFLQYTSGSTSTPRGVIVSHGNLLANGAMGQSAFNISADSVMVGWLPLYHDMGMIGQILQTLYSGGRCVFLAPMKFVQRPLRWLTAISRYRGTISTAPNFGYEYCTRKITDEELLTLDLSSWTEALNGAEPVRAGVLRDFAERFASRGFKSSSFYPCYGLAEATLVVSGGKDFGAPPLVVENELTHPSCSQDARSYSQGEHKSTVVGSGRVVPGLEVVIVDPSTLKPPASESVGEIWISGPCVAEGYWNRPELSSLTFQAFTADGQGPFLRSGDLGFLREEQLFVVGRLKALVIIDGRNHFSEDVELSVQACHPYISRVVVFSIETETGELPIVVAEAERPGLREPADIIRAVRRALMENHELAAREIVLTKVGGIPRTSSGKVQRFQCRENYLAGTYGARTEAPQPAPLGA